MGKDKVTLQEAARRLGVTEGAIRKRVQRDSIEHEKGEDGRVYVYLDEVKDTGSTESQDAGGTLTDELRDRVRFLERALEAEQEGRRRADTIIAQLSQATAEQARAIRELEAPQEPQDQAESAAPRSDRGSVSEEPKTTAQESPHGEAGAEDRGEPERRSIWRRWFGG